MSELDPYTLDEARKAAWKAQPLPEYPVSGAELAAFNYGRDCATAAVSALREVHPIRERRKHERKVAEAISRASVDTHAQRGDSTQIETPSPMGSAVRDSADAQGQPS